MAQDLGVSIHYSILCFWPLPSTGGWTLHNVLVLVRLHSLWRTDFEKLFRDEVFASAKSKVSAIPFRRRMSFCTKRYVNYLVSWVVGRNGMGKQCPSRQVSLNCVFFASYPDWNLAQFPGLGLIGTGTTPSQHTKRKPASRKDMASQRSRWLFGCLLPLFRQFSRVWRVVKGHPHDLLVSCSWLSSLFDWCQIEVGSSVALQHESEHMKTNRSNQPGTVLVWLVSSAFIDKTLSICLKTANDRHVHSGGKLVYQYPDARVAAGHAASLRSRWGKRFMSK